MFSENPFFVVAGLFAAIYMGIYFFVFPIALRMRREGRPASFLDSQFWDAVDRERTRVSGRILMFVYWAAAAGSVLFLFLGVFFEGNP